MTRGGGGARSPLEAALAPVRGREWIALAVGVAAMSWAAPLIRLTEAPSLTVAALRMAFAAAPLLIAARLLRPGELPSLRRGEAAALAVAGLALAAHFAFWVAGAQRTSVVASTAIVSTQPLFVGFGAWALLGERPPRALAAGSAVALAGALLMAGDDLADARSLRGDAFSLLGAVFAAAYLIAGRRVRARVSNLSYAAAVNALAALALLAALAASPDGAGGHPRAAYLLIALLALVPQLIGHGSLTWALGALPAAVVAAAILGEPAGATLIGAGLLGEWPTPLEWLGAALLLAGVAVALRGSARARADGRRP